MILQPTIISGRYYAPARQPYGAAKKVAGGDALGPQRSAAPRHGHWLLLQNDLARRRSRDHDAMIHRCEMTARRDVRCHGIRIPSSDTR